MSEVYSRCKFEDSGWKKTDSSLLDLLCSPKHPGIYFLYHGNLPPEKWDKHITDNFKETVQIASNFAQTCMGEYKNTSHIISPERDVTYIILHGKDVILKATDKRYVDHYPCLNPNPLKLYDTPDYCVYLATGSFDELQEDINNSGLEIIEKAEDELIFFFHQRVDELIKQLRPK